MSQQILFFSSYFLPYLSGLTTYSHQVLTGLAENHSVTVLTFPHNKDLPTQEKMDGLNIRRLPYLFRLSKGFVSIRSWWIFVHFARQSQVIILNLPNAEGWPLAFLGRLMGKKVISIFHCQVQLGRSWHQKLLGLGINLSVAIQLWLSQVVISNTQDYAESIFLGRLFGGKFNYCLPPVKPKPVSPRYLQKLKRKKGSTVWIGFAGRIAREKGLEVLIESLVQLKQLKPEKKYCLVMAGPTGKEVVGEANYFSTIKSLLAKNQIDHLFFDRLSDQELGAFYQAIDVLVLPSTNQTEAFGLVQVEAMLAGKPVIASNLPGVRVATELTGLGCVFEPGNSFQLAELLVNLEQFKTDCKPQLAKQLFDPQNSIEFYERLIG
ncbi:MAG: glycosyltransferase [Candidatus Pacebacteria bacterium]|nr:glycosyltransferase [Candidatus Paceibacterota bacterium]